MTHIVRVAVFLTGVALGVALVALGARIGDDPGLDCPTEDSCTVDYRDGAWHIEEVTP
jgi:hypothetical protein